MHDIKVKQQVYGINGNEKGADWCAEGEEEAIGEKEYAANKERK